MLADSATLLKIINMDTIHTTRRMLIITSDVTTAAAARAADHQVHDIPRGVITVLVIGLDNYLQASTLRSRGESKILLLSLAPSPVNLID